MGKQLKVDSVTGIARVECNSSGTAHSAHPNICASGSVAGMVALGYWDETDVTVKSGGYIYNISKEVISDEHDQLAANNCDCGFPHTNINLREN